MEYKNYELSYEQLLKENSRKKNIYTSWNCSKARINQSVLIENEKEILTKLKEYINDWAGYNETAERRINREDGEILFKNEKFEEALSASFKITKLVYKKLFNEEIKNFTNLDYVNAQEYCMQNAYLMPKTFERKKILDIGAGFGRSLSVPSELVKDLLYCAVDIQKEQYFFQYLFYSCFKNLKFFEYFENTKSFSITNSPGIYHLPTLKMNLLPSNFFDHVICTFVIGEVPIKLAKIFIRDIKRVLKPRGSLYIRDHLNRFFRRKVTLHDLLSKDFFCEFHPYLIDGKEISGNHLIYRKKIKEYPFYNSKNSFLKKLFFKVKAKLI